MLKAARKDKRKGAKKLKTMAKSKLPTHGAKTKWVNDLARKSVDCYDTPEGAEEIIAYVKEIPEKEMGQLTSDPNFHALEGEMKKMLEGLLSTDMRRELDILVADGIKAKKLIWYNGRQLARFIWYWLDKDIEFATSHTYKTVMNIVWWGDNQIPDFRTYWKICAMSMANCFLCKNGCTYWQR